MTRDTNNNDGGRSEEPIFEDNHRGSVIIPGKWEVADTQPPPGDPPTPPPRDEGNE